MNLLGTRRPGVSRVARRLARRLSDGSSGGSTLRVDYARMLDGDRLWLAVTGPAGGLGLREVANGAMHVPADEEGRRTDDLTWVRWHLGGGVLPAEGDLELELVAAGRNGAAPAPVRVPPFADTPTTTPPSADGRWQFGLRRRPDGGLLVSRSAVPERSVLLSATTVTGGVELTCSDTGRVADLLLLREGRVEARLPMIRTPRGTLMRVLADSDVPPGAGRSFDVAIGSATSYVDVVRRRNGLTEPSVAILMPKIFADDDGAELVVTWFSSTGGLHVVRPGAG